MRGRQFSNLTIESFSNLVMKPFTHLHVHSHYSLLDGLPKIDELIEGAKRKGMKALALTDHGAMYGAIEFYKKCLEEGIKPIVGCELYISRRGMKDKEGKLDTDSYHLIVLCKNEEGYKNLMQIVTLAHLEGYYYKPRIDKKTLKKYAGGLIACSACVKGEIPRLILSGRKVRAARVAENFEEIFGKGNFYLEIQNHPEIPQQKKVNAALSTISQKTGISLVATKDVHYLNSEDADAQDVLLCVQTGKTVGDKDRLTMLGADLSFSSGEEMWRGLKDFPEALENTNKIAETCNLKINLGSPKFPHFEVPEGYTPESYMRELSLRGMSFRYLDKERKKSFEEESGDVLNHVPKEIIDRMDYELKVINECGFISYFLIVADFVRFAKDNGILVGPGRGSAAGSLVTYLLGITDLDPLPYGLLFERFLNPERISPPDIDTDFADSRRGEVIEYVSKKYGNDHVAQIITFGKMEARAAVRDVARSLGYSYLEGDRVAKLIPFGMKLKEAMNKTPELKELYQTEESAKKILEMAVKLEGVVRHASTHAAGVVISKKKIVNYTPLQYATKGDISVTTQYSMYYVEDAGLVKMDFLGLSNLTILQNTLRIIRRVKNEEIILEDIPLDDEKTFKLLSRAETVGVFQLSSSGMQRYLKELKPTRFEDIIVMVALYRPGPMDSIPDYIASKHGHKRVTYLHPKLESILKDTYGVIVYQEQVLEIAKALAGFTYGEADILRKAVGKKIKKLLDEQKEKLIEGMVKNDIAHDIAVLIWDFVEPFARYGFNKSHAAGYAMIAYQTAYLKANYPSEFMAALLTSDQDDLDRVARDISECERIGIRVLPPDINESFPDFGVVKETGNLRFALGAIKNVGHKAAEAIVEERKKDGPYESLEDFLKRTGENINKKVLESLIKVGALERFGERGLLLANLQEILNHSARARKYLDSSQIDLFATSGGAHAVAKIDLVVVEPMTKEDRLAYEKELLGIYVSEHPLDDFRKLIEAQHLQIADLEGKSEGMAITLRGIVSVIKKIITRSGEPMLFVSFEDLSGSTELIVFPSVLKENPDIWQDGAVIKIEGKLSFKDKDGFMTEPKIIVEKADVLDKNEKIEEETKLCITLPNGCSKEFIMRLKNILRENKGSSDVYLKVPESDALKEVKITHKVKIKDDFINKLSEFVGQDKIEVR